MKIAVSLQSEGEKMAQHWNKLKNCSKLVNSQAVCSQLLEEHIRNFDVTPGDRARGCGLEGSKIHFAHSHVAYQIVNED